MFLQALRDEPSSLSTIRKRRLQKPAIKQKTSDHRSGVGRRAESGSSDSGGGVNPEQVNTAADRHGLSSIGPDSPSSGL
ncbi:hypothetical protein R3I94_018112 [Phoxinus phoxinus]